MLDPISGISFALGLLGALVSSLQNVVLTAHSLLKAADIIRGHVRTLSDLHMVLDLWKDTYFYGERVLNRRRSRLIWGRDGYRELKQRLTSVLSEEKALLRLLLQDDNLLSQDQKSSWRETVTDCRQKTRPIPHTQTVPQVIEVRVDVARQLVSTLATGTAITTAMTRYKAAIEGLSARSTMYWQVRWGVLDGKPPGREQIEISHQAAELANSFARAVAKQYNDKISLSTWSLVFDMMTNLPGDCQPREAGRLDMRFFVSPDARGHLDQLIRASWSYDHDELHEHSGRTAAELREPLGVHFISGTSGRRQIQQARLARTRAALCIATWVILLWDCKWLRGIESQHLHYVFDNAATYPGSVLYRHPACLTTPEQKLHHRDIDLLLGVLLAELALGTRICLVEGPQVELTTGGMPRILDLEELPQLLLDGKSRSYYRAVKHCFVSYRRNNPHNRAGRRAQYVGEVIVPLQEYYRVLQA